MGTLKITNKMNYTVTSIPNAFIDDYMAKANGEFIKVYLYLLRMLESNKEVSICKIADFLNHTEKDVVRALRYWEQQQLMELTFSDSKELTNITLFNPTITKADTVNDISDISSETVNHVADTNGTISDFAFDSKAISSNNINDATSGPRPDAIQKTVSKKKNYSPAELEEFMKRDEISEMFFVFEKYTGKPLSSFDTNSLLYIYDELNFSVELIEYLIENCVNNGHKSMRYMEKVALTWADDNITTTQQAEAYYKNYTKTFYPVLKAFGLNGRNPGQSEKDFIIKWKDSYGFTMDVIVDACNRTIQNIHQPSFDYADAILSNWNKKGIKTLSQIKQLDEEHSKNSKDSHPVSGNAAKNTFNDFSQRTYDFDALEQRILAN